MSTPSAFKAILLGACIIALSIIIVGTIPQAQAQRGGAAYQLMHHSNPNANAGVFRLDIANGGVSYCFLTGGNINERSNLNCTEEVR